MRLKTIKSCKEATRLMSEHLDRPLPWHRRVLLKMHLAMCINCVYFGRQIRALKDLFGTHTSAGDEPPPADTPPLSRDAQDRIKSSMRDENS